MAIVTSLLHRLSDRSSRTSIGFLFLCDARVLYLECMKQAPGFMPTLTLMMKTPRM
jgi:hypothetical protein